MSVAQEERDRNLAIALDNDEQNRPATTGIAEQDHAHREPFSPLDMIEATRRFNASTVPVVSEPGGDTWVFIDPPPRQHDQDAEQYKVICTHFKNPHCIKSSTLRSLNSPVFNEWLESPDRQRRFLRSRGLLGRLPHHIKVVVDLTLQVEDEHGTHLLSKLMCPEGVRTWVLACSRWNIPIYLLGGHEDYGYLDTRPRTVNEDELDQVFPKRQLLKIPGKALGSDEIRVKRRAPSTYDTQGNERNALETQQEYVIPAESSAIRHHCAIERVLNILVDHDPKLDSAPKVWTTFVMAKHLGVANHVNINNYIIRWLQASRNTAFLDVMPELCLDIADGLQNFALCRSAFALLVGERALDSIGLEPNSLIGGKSKSHSVTVHGRKKYDIPEAYQTRLEYAYIGFREMVFREYATLVEGDWIKDLFELHQLSFHQHDDPAYQTELRKLRRLLLGYVRGSIMFALRAQHRLIPGPWGDHHGDDEIFPATKFATIWEGLSLQHRLLTRSFWSLLYSQSLDTSISNNEMNGYNFGRDQTCVYTSFMGELDGESKVEDAIPMTTVKKAVAKCLHQLVDAKILKLQPEGKRKEKIVDNTNGTSESRSSDAAWDDTTYSLELCFSDRLETLSPPANPPDQKVSSDKHTAKRPKIESPIGHEAQAPVGMPLEHGEHCLYSRFYPLLEEQVWLICSIVALPFRPSLFPSNSSKEQKRTSNFDLLDFTKGCSSWYQHLHPQPPTQSDPNQTPWTTFVEVENPATLEAASPAQENNTLHENFESHFFEEALPDFEETQAAEKTQAAEEIQASEDERLTYTVLGTRFFNLETFLKEADAHIRMVCRRMLPPENEEPCKWDFCLSNCLRCLTDDEWKYLPLWAGGNDDGSGGVFDDEIPIPDAQFTTAGPKVFSSGNSNAASASSEFDMVSGGGSTRNTSTAVQDGFSDTLDRHRTYAASEISEISDSPSTVGRLASELEDYDLLSDITERQHESHVDGSIVSGNNHKVVEADQKQHDTDEGLDTELSIVAMSKARAEPDDLFDDVFASDSDGEATETEGEDQVFEED